MWTHSDEDFKKLVAALSRVWICKKIMLGHPRGRPGLYVMRQL